MKNLVPILISLLLLSMPAASQGVAPIDTSHMVICPATGSAPDFTDPGCMRAGAVGLGLHHQHVWLKANIFVRPTLMESPGPLGLRISAKAASRVWLNGHYVGANGQPGGRPEEEVPGKMDHAFALGAGVVRAGDNEIVLELSSQHSLIPLVAPVHVIAITPYVEPTDSILRGYLPSFLPLGILLLGTLYFGAASLRGARRRERLIVPLMALFAAAQLVSEVSRGLVAYDYPFHDVRLILILGFATATGFCLFFHVLNRFVSRGRLVLGAAMLVAYLLAVVPTGGFDAKSSLALLLPTLLSALIAGFSAVRRVPGATGYTAALTLFAVLIYLTSSRFLDVYFYYCVAALLVFLFAQELGAHLKERRRRTEEQARADRLQLILDESHERERPSALHVSSAGKVELLQAGDIAYVKGAGDYVELVLADGTTKLHTATLAELENTLPGTFLRVHRSYLVNTSYISTLERDTTGGGMLLLKGGDSVPVSRRIMPSVRKALT